MMKWYGRGLPSEAEVTSVHGPCKENNMYLNTDLSLNLDQVALVSKTHQTYQMVTESMPLKCNTEVFIVSLFHLLF